MSTDIEERLLVLQKCAEHAQNYKLRMRLREVVNEILPTTVLTVQDGIDHGIEQELLDMLMDKYRGLFFEILREFLYEIGASPEEGACIVNMSTEIHNTPILERDITDDVHTYWTFLEFSLRLLLEIGNGSQTNNDEG